MGKQSARLTRGSGRSEAGENIVGLGYAGRDVHHE